jgi:hypothetical protein
VKEEYGCFWVERQKCRRINGKKHKNRLGKLCSANMILVIYEGRRPTCRRIKVKDRDASAPRGEEKNRAAGA